MTRLTTPLAVTLGISCIIALAQPAAAQYAYTTLIIPAGAVPNGVNDTGVIARLYVQNWQLHGFTLTAGTFNTVDYTGETSGSALLGINNAGVMAGAWFDQTPYRLPHGFFGTSPSNFISFDIPGDSWGTEPSGINNLGVIVGTWWDATPMEHGFTYNSHTGAWTSFDFPGSGVQGTMALGINDSGAVVGYYCAPGTCAYFLYANGQFSIPTPPNEASFILVGIDNSGDLIGNGSEAPGGFILVKGQIIPVCPPDARVVTFTGSAAPETRSPVTPIRGRFWPPRTRCSIRSRTL